MPVHASQTPLDKRIKRHVIGRDHAFFASTAPGLEPLLLEEIGALPTPPARAEIVPGGVQFSARLTTCYLANLHLRTAQRVLMRLAEFRAEGYARLRARLAEIPWELHISPQVRVETSVVIRHCRLHHSGAVSECVLDAVRERFGGPAGRADADPNLPTATVFVRAVDDRFVVSLDSSGELLHRRGLKTHPARAPLRETLAAAALLSAGYDGTGPVLDPMCGSGTFAVEAALIARRIPPGLARGFAFTAWPAFRPAHWAHLRKGAEQGILPALGRPMVFASDLDGPACRELEAEMERVGLADVIAVRQADFFDLAPGGTPGTLVLNPPYGRRIGSPGRSRKRLAEIYDKIRRDYRGWRLALVIPADLLGGGPPFPMHSRRVHHGNLDLVLLAGLIR